jgi:hypothetical protein
MIVTPHRVLVAELKPRNFGLPSRDVSGVSPALGA